MSKTVQSATLRITTVGPINIGTSQKLTTKDYMYNYDAGEVYLLHQRNWFMYLMKANALYAFEEYLLNELPRPNGRSMYQWAVDTLGKDSISLDKLGVAVKSCMRASRNVESRKNSLNDIVPQIRTIDGTIYIPGSSIKGMIDTAILEHLITTDTRLKSRLEQEVKRLYDAYRNRNYDEQKLHHKSLEKNIQFAITRLVDKDGQNLKGVLGSVYRGISVSDAMPIASITTEVLQKVDHGLDAGAINTISVWRECILPNNQFECSITIDTSITKHIGIHSIDDLLQIIAKSYDRIHKLLRHTFKRVPESVWKQSNSANAYIGANTGFLQKSAIMAICDDNPKLGIDLIKHMLDKQFRKQAHKHISEDRVISPRMIKLTEWNQTLWEMGGVRIERI